MAIVLYTGVNNNTNIPGVVKETYPLDAVNSSYVGLSNQGRINFSSIYWLALDRFDQENFQSVTITWLLIRLAPLVYYGSRFKWSLCLTINFLWLGATCYLNSLIQTMFMTPEFRRAVFKWTYNKEKDGEESLCIPLQLQRLFGYLQLSKSKAVDTVDLTRWERALQRHG